MRLSKLGLSPIDKYSKPVSQKETKLATIFYMKARETAEKPGRALAVMWDERLPLVKGFVNRYTYTVDFSKAGKSAGNHFHKVKQELFIPIKGEFTIHLADVKSKKNEQIRVSAHQHAIIFIRTGIAHKVVAKSDVAVLLVIADHLNVEGDEFPYNVN